MYYLYIITGGVLLISIIKDYKRTISALKIACKKFIKILPAFLTMMVLVSIILYMVPDSAISEYLGKNKLTDVFVASLLGSITLMPGFIAYPLCGILLQKGVTYMVLGAFTTTLMMVGIVTYPIEKEYFGTKITIVRNVISFIIAIIIAFAIGFFFGEL
jgi:uncharacterized membrane protein YraQ (UPF0718 family)